MIVAVTDTHSFIWYLDADRRLSERARQTIDSATQAGDDIGVSVITLVETVYLVEKDRVPRQTLARMIAEIRSPQSVFVEIPLNIEIILALRISLALTCPTCPTASLPRRPCICRCRSSAATQKSRLRISTPSGNFLPRQRQSRPSSRRPPQSGLCFWLVPPQLP